MANSATTTRFRFWFWLIRLIGVIVPRRLRANWRQEWEAELRHRESLLAEWDRLDWRQKLDLLRRSSSAFWDALWLQPQRLEDEMFQDLRYGARMLLKKPDFTLMAVLTLALGIGASTAIFSAVNPILFEPLPYPHADRIVMIWEARKDGARIESTFGTYRALRRAESFLRRDRRDEVMAADHDRPDRAGTIGRAARERELLPRAGRVAGDRTGFPGIRRPAQRPRVAILSDGLWRRRFGADSAIVGRQVTLDDNSYTVIGVMPSAFENVLAPSAELWTPLQYDQSLPPQSREWGHHLRMVGRLRPGAGTDQARRELDQIAHDPVPDLPQVRRLRRPRSGFIVNSLQDDVTSAVKPALLAVLGAVMLLLTIACVNVTNLLLARGAQRRGEFAMRAALGAGRTADDPATAHGKSAACLPRRRSRDGCGGVRCAGVGGAQSTRAAAGGRDSCRRDRLRLRTGNHHADRAGGRADSSAARVPQRPARRIAAKLTAHRRWSPIDAPRAGRRGGRARPRAAGERGIAVAQPAASVRDRSGIRRVAACLRCRCRHPAADSTRTPRTGSSRRLWRRCARFLASRRRRSPASCR